MIRAPAACLGCGGRFPGSSQETHSNSPSHIVATPGQRSNRRRKLVNQKLEGHRQQIPVLFFDVNAMSKARGKL